MSNGGLGVAVGVGVEHPYQLLFVYGRQTGGEVHGRRLTSGREDLID
jgi:hypothetical protein